MAASIVTLAESVTTLLRDRSIAGNFSQSFSPVRAYVPQYNLQDMNVLHVTVVPRSSTVTVSDRRHLLIVDYSIDVAVQKRVPNLDNTEFDGLLGLVEEIGTYLLTAPVENFTVIGMPNDPIYDPSSAAEFRQFTSVLSMQYRQLR